MTDLPRRAGWPAAPGALVQPLMPSVVYTSADPDALDQVYDTGEGFVYAREGHPNAAALAARLDGLHGAAGGWVTGSGMAAVGATLMACLRAGDHVIGGDQLYGRSLRMMDRDMDRMGVSVTLVDPTDVDAVRAAIRPETRLILIETVSNPTLRVADLPGIIALAEQAGVWVAVDNTFATPLGCRPLDLGAHVVIESVTKLLGGHSDVTLGYVATTVPELADRLGDAVVTWGMTPSPFDCWLADRGLQTFALRHERACANAAAIADALAGDVETMIYPTRAGHPDAGHSGYLANGGHMVTFCIPGGRAEANALVRAADGIVLAPTLGDVATTLSHSVTSSHRGMTPEGRAALGITEGLFRLSVGVEPADVLIDSLRTAIRAAR